MADSFDRTFEAIAKGVWRAFVVLVKLIFRGIGSLINAVRNRRVPSKEGMNPEQEMDALMDCQNAADSAAVSGDWPRALQGAGGMLKHAERMRVYVEGNEPAQMPLLHMLFANAFYLRWMARDELTPAISHPGPDENMDECLARDRARMASLFPDLENAAHHFEKAYEGRVNQPPFTTDAARGFGFGIWRKLGDFQGSGNPGKAYAAYKRSMDLMDNSGSFDAFDSVGSAAREAGEFTDFEERASKLIAKYPNSFSLLSGAADAFWSAGIRIKRDGVTPQEFEERTSLLKQAVSYAERAVQLEPSNPDVVHLQGRIFAALDDVPSLETVVDRLISLERSNPLPVDVAQRRFHADSRVDHLRERLDSSRKYLARRNA